MYHLHPEFSKTTISLKAGIVHDAKLYDKEIIAFRIEGIGCPHAAI
jgi:hypothetical protein